jgi:hypothetical protein
MRDQTALKDLLHRFGAPESILGDNVRVRIRQMEPGEVVPEGLFAPEEDCVSCSSCRQPAEEDFVSTEEDEPLYVKEEAELRVKLSGPEAESFVALLEDVIKDMASDLDRDETSIALVKTVFSGKVL